MHVNQESKSRLRRLPSNQPIWERFFSVYPLVLVGSKDPDGSYDIAPKHMAMPVSWSDYYGFVCAPTHRTYQNIERERAFTVSYPKPSQIVMTSLAADPRDEEGDKPALAALPTFRAESVDGVLIEDAYLYLECHLYRIVEKLGENCLIIGRIAAVHVDEQALRSEDLDDQELIRQTPLLAYLYPGRFASIERSFSFPFPRGFKR
ncbi:MAG: flavin reductase family protein [Gammaproteobacteria bacterium]